MYERNLDLTIREALFKQPKKAYHAGKIDGQIGLELEMEGQIDVRDDCQYWTQHVENSLKDGGTELVLRKPVTLEELPVALAEVKKILRFSTIKQSLRTSTHVHVNVLDFPMRSVYSAIAAWWLVEDALIYTQGPHRKGNLFCLALSDAEGILDNILRDIHAAEHFHRCTAKALRYAALNVSAIAEFGSLEFRFLRGMTDPEEVRVWTEALYHFVQLAAARTWDEIKALARADALTILKTFFTPTFIKHLLAVVPLSFLKKSVQTNIDSIFLLFKELERYERRYSPVDFGDEDVEKPTKAQSYLQDVIAKYTNMAPKLPHYDPWLAAGTIHEHPYPTLGPEDTVTIETVGDTHAVPQLLEEPEFVEYIDIDDDDEPEHTW